MKEQVGVVYAFRNFNRVTETESRIAKCNIKGKHL